MYKKTYSCIVRRSRARLGLARRLLAVDVNVTASLPQLRLYDRRRVRPLADLPQMYDSFSRITKARHTLVG